MTVYKGFGPGAVMARSLGAITRPRPGSGQAWPRTWGGPQTAPATPLPGAYRSQAGGTLAAGLSKVVTLPSSIPDGSIMLAVFTACAASAPPTLGWDPAWTQLGSTQTGGGLFSFGVFTRIALKEPASYTWTASGVASANFAIEYIVLDATGTDASIQFSAVAAASTTVVAPSVTTAKPNSIVVILAGASGKSNPAGGSSTPTYPGTATLEGSQVLTGGTVLQSATAAAGIITTDPAAGATATQTVTWSVAAAASCAATIALTGRVANGLLRPRQPGQAWPRGGH